MIGFKCGFVLAKIGEGLWAPMVLVPKVAFANLQRKTSKEKGTQAEEKYDAVIGST